MHDPGRVDRDQRLRQPGRQAVQVPGAERPGRLDVPGQRRPGGVLGDEEQPAGVGAGLDHPDDTRAPDPGQHSHLPAEPGPEFRILSQLQVKHFHRD